MHIPVENPYTYTGREYDPETGLYYYRARYYDPKAGRFIQEDPAGFFGSFNFYTYVANNPVNFVDPYGLIGPTGRIIKNVLRWALRKVADKVG